MRGNRGYRTFTISCALVFMALITCLSGCTAVREWSSNVYAGGVITEPAIQNSEPATPIKVDPKAKPTLKEEPIPPIEEESAPPSKDKQDTRKLVALTFDDGPDNNYTSDIMDILKEYKVHATFFVVGLQVVKYPEMAKRIVDEGHTIGNHSWSHKDLTKLTSIARDEEINKTQQAIKEATGIVPELMRAPYGAISDAVLKSIHNENMKHVYWTVDTRDWAGTAVADMHENVLANTDVGGIILMHSFGGRRNAIAHTIKLLPSLIEDLTAKGYEFVTVDELIEADQAYASIVK